MVSGSVGRRFSYKEGGEYWVTPFEKVCKTYTNVEGGLLGDVNYPYDMTASEFVKYLEENY